MAADRAEDQAGNPSPVASHEAHGAGLAAGVHHSILGVSQGHDFRVGSRVSQFDYAASAFRSDFIRDDHDCAASGRPRTEELRALTWDQVNLEGNPAANPPVSAVHHGVAFRPGAGKDQDEETAAASGPQGMAGKRPSVRVRRRNAAEREQCAALVPQHRREDKPQRRRPDTAINATQLRFAALRFRRADRPHRPASRPRWRLDGHGDGLPQADPPCLLEGAEAMDRIFGGPTAA